VVVTLHRLNNVSVVPIALGGASGVEKLSVPVKASGSYGFGLSHLGRPQDRWSAIAEELVALTTLDAIAAVLDLDRLDFIKADIEGWELALLRGGEKVLRRFRPTLLLELSAEHLARAGEELDDVFSFLAALRYTAFELSPAGKLVATTDRRDGDLWFIPAEQAPSAIG